MDPYLDNELKNMEECLIETYELAAIYGDDSQKNTTSFVKHFEEIIEIRSNALHQAKALEIAKNERSANDLKSKYLSELQKINNKKSSSKKASEVQAFEQRLKDIAEATSSTTGNRSDASRVVCGDFVMESELNVFDPLTKLRMKDPMRNKLCGHHYEMSSIFEAISLNKRLRCPVAGCGNTQFVKKEHLEADNVMKMRLMKLAERVNIEYDSD